NLYSIFIEKGLCILNSSGILSYINPNSMLVNSSYYELRKYILPYLIKVIKLPDNVFEDAKVETIIFELHKNHSCNKISIISYSKDERILYIDDSKTVYINKSDWESDKSLSFNLYATNKHISII